MQYISIGMRDFNTVLSLAKLTLEVLSGVKWASLAIQYTSVLVYVATLKFVLT